MRRAPATRSLAGTLADIALPVAEIQVVAILPRAPATVHPAADIPAAEVIAAAVDTPAARVAAEAVDPHAAAVEAVDLHAEVVEEAVAVTPTEDTIAKCDLTLAPHSCSFSRLWRI